MLEFSQYSKKTHINQIFLTIIWSSFQVLLNVYFNFDSYQFQNLKILFTFPVPHIL